MTVAANSGDHGVDLKQAYASTDEASVSLEYSELEEAQLAEEEAEKARCFLHPNKRFRSIWDLSILLLLLYVVSGHRTFDSHVRCHRVTVRRSSA